MRRHLADKGLLRRAPLYYRNSVGWQSLLRKYCFETARRAETFAGYDFLGDIDTHWHTFGYCVGMMNEFYEMKPGETVQNVRRYNSGAVLLAALPRCRNFFAGEKISVPVLVSNYQEAMDKATLNLRLSDGKTVVYRKTVHCSDLKLGEITQLYRLECVLPRVTEPARLKLVATLSGGNVDAENEWELYLYPKVKSVAPKTLVVAEHLSAEELISAMQAGKTVVLLGAGPFPKEKISFQISLAGRTNGHLATVIADHPALEGLPHEGFCGWQFREMLNGGQAIVLEHPDLPFAPIIEAVPAYKNVRKEALLAEYRVGAGKLLVCSLDLKASDPGAVWLRSRLIAYAQSEEFAPEFTISPALLGEVLGRKIHIDAGGEVNNAGNVNDITL